MYREILTFEMHGEYLYKRMFCRSESDCIAMIMLTLWVNCRNTETVIPQLLDGVCMLLIIDIYVLQLHFTLSVLKLCCV